MLIPFIKMNSLGNDYIIIDLMKDVSLYDLVCRNVVHLSSRRSGIGADGVLLIQKSDIADFKMIIFNSDGSRGLMCGNGLVQCVKYFCENHRPKKHALSIETDSGLMCVRVDRSTDCFVQSISLDFPLRDISSCLFNPPKEVGLLNDAIVSFVFESLMFYVFQMGPLHAITFINSDIDTFDFAFYASRLSVMETIFPQGVNVEFVKINSDKEIEVRIWERGVGHSLACGTGATAAAALSFILGKITAPSVLVRQENGCIRVSRKSSDLFVMHGVADYVFYGTIDLV